MSYTFPLFICVLQECGPSFSLHKFSMQNVCSCFCSTIYFLRCLLSLGSLSPIIVKPVLGFIIWWLKAQGAISISTVRSFRQCSVVYALCRVLQPEETERPHPPKSDDSLWVGLHTRGNQNYPEILRAKGSQILQLPGFRVRGHRYKVHLMKINTDSYKKILIVLKMRL